MSVLRAPHISYAIGLAKLLNRLCEILIQFGLTILTIEGHDID